ANIKGTRLWTLLLDTREPKDSVYKSYEYDFGSPEYSKALMIANKLVSKFQGKLPSQVRIPDSLIPHKPSSDRREEKYIEIPMHFQK
ncbi:MAG: hypothetical protein KKC05_01735, partial [Nanoarchaeota archaeon]|nr:hypothetical protein [Nanoarchaeota archaeon]